MAQTNYGILKQNREAVLAFADGIEAAIPNMTYTPAVKFFNTKNCSKT